MTLVLEATVSHLARPVKEDGSGERISGFAFVQPRVDAAVQLDVVQPIEGQHTTLDPAQFSKGYRPSVLSGRAAELAQHQRSRPSPLTNGCRQPKNLVQWLRICLVLIEPPTKAATSGKSAGLPGTYHRLSARSRIRGANRKPKRCIRPNT